MRLFLAIDLPKEMKDYLFELEKKPKEAKITWVSKKNLHLTLKFFGEVNKEQLLEIKKRLRFSAKPIQAYISTMGFFPNKKAPRVIWVAVEPEDEIIGLQQRLDQAFLDIFPSDQKFQSHITLGRIKSIRRKDDFFKSVDSIKIEPRTFIIDSFQLIKSELTKTGPIYEVVEVVALS